MGAHIQRHSACILVSFAGVQADICCNGRHRPAHDWYRLSAGCQMWLQVVCVSFVFAPLRAGLQTPLRAGLQAPSLTMLSSTPKCCCTGLTPPCLCWCLLQGPSQLARRARLHTLLQPGSSSELDGEAHGCYRCEHPTARREHPGQALPMGYRRCARRRGAWGVTGCLTLTACDLYSHSLANSGGGGGGAHGLRHGTLQECRYASVIVILTI